jgi:hypothetical protein
MMRIFQINREGARRLHQRLTSNSDCEAEFGSDSHKTQFTLQRQP